MTLSEKEYVTFARKFVKETVATMDIEELRGIVTDHIHEMIQEEENTYGQEGAFEEMMSWDEDVFLDVAKDKCGNIWSEDDLHWIANYVWNDFWSNYQDLTYV